MRIIDLALQIILIVPNVLIFYIYDFIGGGIIHHKTKGIVKATEFYKDEYVYINQKCDKSYGDDEHREESLEDLLEYSVFKHYVTRNDSRRSNYNPTNMMLSEISVTILIAVLKILNPAAQKYGKGYLPISYVTHKLRDYMFIFRT